MRGDKRLIPLLLVTWILLHLLLKRELRPSYLPIGYYSI
uniref:Uncharacterized protein n=1 Tax=Arundo donax TaxID=35708 RepID=A0A0A9QA31_ARUDO